MMSKYRIELYPQMVTVDVIKCNFHLNFLQNLKQMLCFNVGFC